MIMAWLGGKFLGLPRGLLVLLGLLLLLAGLCIYIVKSEEADDRANQEIGATVEREKALSETVKRVEEANVAREEINRNDDAGAQLRYNQCLRSARTPANCERFLRQ